MGHHSPLQYDSWNQTSIIWLVRSTWCRTHHHNYQQSEAKEQTGLSTNSSSFPDEDFLWWHLRLSLHSFFGWGGESLPQSLLKQGHVLSSFQPAFPITSSFCPSWVLHIGYIFSTGITQAPFIKTTKFRHGWLSGWLTRPCTGVSFPALVTFYFSLGFLVLQCLSPIRQAYTTGFLHREAPFKQRTADINIQSTQITRQQAWLSPARSPRTQRLNIVPRGAAWSLCEQGSLQEQYNFTL